MQQEIDLLVNAIESLRQEPDYFRDYIFPTASALFGALFGALLGAGVASYTIRYQNRVQSDREKIDAANRLLLLVEGAQATLLSIKGNYSEELPSEPFERLSRIPTILFHATPILYDFAKLSFIAPTAKADRSGLAHWSNIPRIRAMVSNYNYLLELWENRNQVERPFREALLQDTTSQGFATLTPEQVINKVGGPTVATLIDITEKTVRLTDDVLIELNDFLCEFPAYARTLSDKNERKKYGEVLLFSNNENEQLLSALERTSSVDFSSVQKLFGMTVDQIEKRHETGYEK